MPVETWAAFVAVALGVIALPGPTVLLVVGLSLSGGARAAGAAVLGVALGDALAIAAAFLGTGALLAASPALFEALRWAGAGYLLWLGIAAWRAAPPAASAPTASPPGGAWRIVGRAATVTLLNPKGLLFFAAFLPQFVDPGRPAPPQMLTLAATHLTLATAVLTAYAAAAHRLRPTLANAADSRLPSRIGGSLMIAAAVAGVAVGR